MYGSAARIQDKNRGSATLTVSGETSSFFIVGCNHTVDQITNGELEIHHIAGTDNGTVTAVGLTWTVETTITPEFIRSCVYGTGAGTDIGTLTGGTWATLDIHGVINKVEGTFLCPSTIVVDAKYQIITPENLYVEPE